jgi:Leucine-rich repeat (LRR) protein
MEGFDGCSRNVEPAISYSLSTMTMTSQEDSSELEGQHLGSPLSPANNEDTVRTRIERQLEQYTKSLDLVLDTSRPSPTARDEAYDSDLLIRNGQRDVDDDDDTDDNDGLDSELSNLKQSRYTLQAELMYAKHVARIELEQTLTTVSLDCLDGPSYEDNDGDDNSSANDEIQNTNTIHASFQEQDSGQVAYLDEEFYRKHHQRLQQKEQQRQKQMNERYEQDQLPSVEEYKADARYRARFSLLRSNGAKRNLLQGVSSRRPDPPECLKRTWRPVTLSTILPRQDFEATHHAVQNDDVENGSSQQHEKLISPRSIQEATGMELEDFGAQHLNPTMSAAQERKGTHSSRRVVWLALGCCILPIIAALVFSRFADQVTNSGESRLKDVQLFLAEYGYTKLDLLETPNTPQYRAATWIADVDAQHLPFRSYHKGALASAHATFVYRYALAVFYFALGGGSAWMSNLNFLSDGHVCTWVLPIANDLGGEVYMGVNQCMQFAGDLIPVGLNLRVHGLQGTIPEEIRLLDRLETLILQYNAGLGGSLPSSMSTLSSLKVLSIQHCSISNVIPDWIGNMEQLTNLGLGSNRLTGTIPSSIQKLTSLQALGLDNNVLSADLDLFGPLTSLRYLYLDNNMIHGRLTSSLLSGWKELVELDISENYLTATLPPDLFAHEHLQVLDLHANRLTGVIPEVRTAQGYALEFLALHENGLEGGIPKSLGLLQELRHLDLSLNHVSGQLPSTLGSLTKLEYLFAGQNELNVGPLPTFLGELTNLRELSLDQSGITGIFPDFLGFKLSNLELVDFSQNLITSRLPESIGFLSNLDHLVLNRNEMTGNLPGSLVKLTKLSTFLRLLLLRGSTSNIVAFAFTMLTVQITLQLSTITGFLLFDENGFSGSANFLCVTNQDQIKYFAADCGGVQPELECSCCTLCCRDNVQTCNDIDFHGNLDPTWETNYERSKYEFGLGTMYSP